MTARSRVRLLAAALPLAVFATLAVLLWRGLGLDPQAVPSPLIGRAAPDFSLARLDDASRTMRRDELRGRAYVLNVWASWCAGCRDEHPLLLELARTARVPIVGLDYKDRRPDALAWLQRHGDPYAATLFDEGGGVGLDFGVYGVPETFVVDAAGIVRAKLTGPLTREIVERRLVPLLKALDG